VDAADRDVVQQRLARRAVVGVLVIWGHGTLVAEEDVDPAPVEPVGVVSGERPVGRLRGRAAGERDGEAAAFVYRLFGSGGEVAGCGRGQLIRRLVDKEIQGTETPTAVRRASS
jgi:hypothetical protein